MTAVATAPVLIPPEQAGANNVETVLWVKHWTKHLFSFAITRPPSFRFRSGEFVMIGLPGLNGGKPVLRAYSIASPSFAEELEFFSIKVEDGPLTSRLQQIKPGDQVLLGKKPTGTLVLDALKPGKRLFLFGTGTGLAPFLSLIRDPEAYERFDKVILFHGVRHVNELAYQDYIENQLPNDEFLGEMVREKLLYYPSVTREPYRNRGRLTDLIISNKMTDDLGLPPLNPETDRAMICGSPSMNKDTADLLDARGFVISPGIGEPGDYVIERAFVER